MNAADIRAVEAIERKLDAEYRDSVRRKHRREYPDSVLSDPGEPDGPNSYPVPWMWTDIYRYAPSELTLLAGENDPDFDAWFADWSDRFAHSQAKRVWHKPGMARRWMVGPNRRQRARAGIAS